MINSCRRRLITEVLCNLNRADDRGGSPSNAILIIEYTHVHISAFQVSSEPHFHPHPDLTQHMRAATTIINA